MMRNIATILLCLVLAACANCNISADNDDNQERCWIFQKGI
ncbi:hypothetical protein [Paramagnetospirillum marisnigri]|nr:hypothetical protein [Paramagnetospirillum marisnigri]